MSETELSDIVTPMTEGFRRIPPAAVPAMLDCVMASTGLSPSSLFSLLLDAFPILTKGIIHGNKKLDTEDNNFIMSFISASCHLLKKSAGVNDSDMRVFIWKILVPVIKLVDAHDCSIFNETADLFFNVVTETNSWVIVEESLVPFSLSSLGFSMGILQSEGLVIYEWSTASVHSDYQLTNSENDTMFFSLHSSCRVLALILNCAVQSQYALVSSLRSSLGSENFIEKFVKKLLWDLCNMTFRMLLHSTEHRSCAVEFLLPTVFKAFVTLRAFEILVRGQSNRLSRMYLFKQVWICCKMLFLLGPLERRDSYRLLSLYLSFFSRVYGEGNNDTIDGEEDLDITVEKEFWVEMKKGLVDKESMVRKQSLHILKMILLADDGSQSYPNAEEMISSKKDLMPNGQTKKGRWADKEAESLGVGKVCNSVVDSCMSSQQKWGAFFLLYEMLEEYGIHLVEAAWNHQITSLLHVSLPHGDLVNSVNGVPKQKGMLPADIFNWLAVLWERGFMHDNPNVRCLIMDSFLGIEWKNYRHCAELVPEDFVLGSFIQGLNDPVHHRDFGIKGIYSSVTIEGAAKFIFLYADDLNSRERIAFLTNLVSAAKKQSFGRAGLMALTGCIASAARGMEIHINDKFQSCGDEIVMGNSFHNEKAELLDGLRFIIESSKQHFNPKYRIRVCKNVLEAAVSVMQAADVPLETLLLFISAVPREFTDYGGSLRVKVQAWVSASDDKCRNSKFCSIVEILWKSLCDYPISFVGQHVSVSSFNDYDDEDLGAWEFKAQRWARVLFLVNKEQHHVDVISTFVRTYAVDLSNGKNLLVYAPVKLLILLMSLIQELQVLQEKLADSCKKGGSESGQQEIIDYLTSGEISFIIKKFGDLFSSILEGLISFATSSCNIFWSGVVEDTGLPSSIRGKLGGPSQRRLSSSATTEVLQAIMSLKAIASITSWCVQFASDGALSFAFIFLWSFFQKIVSSPPCESETAVEVRLASYEALAHVLKAVVSQFSYLDMDIMVKGQKPTSLDLEGKSLLDSLVLTFLHNINNLIAVEKLARTRRAVLLNLKWTCLEYLLSIPMNAFDNAVCVESNTFLFSDATLHLVFDDIVDSLENAGEDSVLPMLRSVRLVLEIFHSQSRSYSVSSGDGVNAKMMWNLVSSSWILHVNCNKRRVAPIAALISSILHYSVFVKEYMHESDGEPGPLKWFVEKLLEEGTRSPRTIRLAALHLTGLMLVNPKIIQYYMKELKLLTLYGSVAFDEDFEAELAENNEARREASLLAKSPDSELTEAFINTELYARVSVAVLFYKLADMSAVVGNMEENETMYCRSAFESGKMFLMELLDFVANDKDIAKELYKKYSGVHRRKVRVLQMICVLSQFVDQDMLEAVTSSLHVALYRNNLPAVRQYLETFAINIYLKFPMLVTEQLVPVFQNYDMRPQALSSYVFIAANVILHAPPTLQHGYLAELLPPIIPLLTSHHHSLRGFTQLLVFQVLCKVLPLDPCPCGSLSLEKRCFEDLKAYLQKNSDCARLRESMKGYLDNFNPSDSVTPAGIFSNRVEEVEFECVPTPLMDQVTAFLNDVREDLRCSMAKDAEIIKNESLWSNKDPNCTESPLRSSNEKLQLQLAKDLQLDFQRKITISKHDGEHTGSESLWKNDSFKPLMEFEKEDELLEELLHSTSAAMEKMSGDRQSFILVGSLLDRIPNLAGLARTCEVFKAAGFTVADANIVRDKQFQLISVTAEKWVPLIEVPVSNLKVFLQKKKREGFSILGLEQTANSVPLDQFVFPKKMVLVLGREKEGIPVEIIHFLDACIEIPQLGVVRSLNVHVSGAIALWEYTRQQRSL